MSVHVNFLAHIPLLRTLPESVRLAVAARMVRRTLARRAVALEKGARGQPLGFVLTGRLQAVDFTLDGREAGLYFVGPGEVYGELATIDGGENPEFVIAICQTEVLEMAAADARALLLPNPHVAEALARRLAARLREAIALRSVLALPNPMQRLSALLVGMSGPAGAIAHVPTHQELAIMINTTRETVTRILRLLFDQGIVQRQGEQLAVLQPERLLALARGEAGP